MEKSSPSRGAARAPKSGRLAVADQSRTGAKILVDQLITHGVDTVFFVPGESYLATLDALHDVNSIRLVGCRQEGGGAMMADAYGKLTGRPGVCMVSRGPGATNASSGLHVAMQDSTPMILFIGQVPRRNMEREAFQEIDYRRMFGQLAKCVIEIDRPDRISEFVSRAFHLATSGRPGPVVLVLPEDILAETAVSPDAVPYQQIESHPGPAVMAQIRDALSEAERPMILVGGSIWDAQAVACVEEFARTNEIVCCAAFRRQDRFDNAHPFYAGEMGLGANPRLVARFKEADLLLVIGSRLGEVVTGGYRLMEIPTPRQRLIHVYPDPDEFAHVYRPSLAVIATPRTFAQELRNLKPIDHPRWSSWSADAHSVYLTWIEPTRMPGALQLGEVMTWLNDNLPTNAIFTNGAGNFSVWLHRFHQYRSFGTQVAPVAGAMGYGLPAAVAAKVVYPERPVICMTGDGDFQMTGQELGTAVSNRLNVIVLLVNNGMYGTIRMHQERTYPGRVVGTELRSPDFVRLAQAYGAYGETVGRTADFGPAFRRAQQADGPAILELRIDPEAITPQQTLSGIRNAAKSTD